MTKGRCAKCGERLILRPGTPVSYEVDHIHPKSKGGHNEIANFQPLCKQCNGAKSNLYTADYRSTRVRTDSAHAWVKGTRSQQNRRRVEAKTAIAFVISLGGIVSEVRRSPLGCWRVKCVDGTVFYVEQRGETWVLTEPAGTGRKGPVVRSSSAARMKFKDDVSW